jgi:hypothetical protein
VRWLGEAHHRSALVSADIPQEPRNRSRSIAQASRHQRRCQLEFGQAACRRCQDRHFACSRGMRRRLQSPARFTAPPETVLASSIPPDRDSSRRPTASPRTVCCLRLLRPGRIGVAREREQRRPGTAAPAKLPAVTPAPKARRFAAAPRPHVLSPVMVGSSGAKEPHITVPRRTEWLRQQRPSRT